MSILPTSVSNKLSQEMVENIYNYDDTYKKMYNNVMYNFYWDMFQDSKFLFSKVLQKKTYDEHSCWMNVIAEGARSMEKIYIEKNNKDYASHIDASLWVA